MFFLKWVQLNGHRERNEFDEANRNDTEDNINKIILEAGGLKKKRKKNPKNSSIMFTKTARTPQRERDRKQTAKRRRRRREEGTRRIKME